MNDVNEGPELPLFDRVAIIGLGLIGSSLARALRQRRLCNEIIGCARSDATLDLGLELGVIDRAEKDPAKAVKNADLIMLAMPIGATGKVLDQIASHVSPQAIITDAGSVKGSVIKAAIKSFGTLPSRFIPGHPIAGSERSGVEAGNADLYVNHKVILTPLDSADADALELVSLLWRSVGAEVVIMDADHHDQVLAATSHLPHLLAFSLVDTLAGEEGKREIFNYAAGGFRDFTRIASSDPVMWRDIFLANKEATVDVLDRFIDGLVMLRDQVVNQDGDELLNAFSRAKSARDYFTEQSESKARVDAVPLTRTESVTQTTPPTTPQSGKAKQSQFSVKPSSFLQGNIRVPGDKSISHRSIMFGSLAEGITEVEGFLEGDDALATLQSFRDMGVVIEGPENGRVKIHGVGMNGLKKPSGPLDLGNSGTSMRLLMGLLSAQAFDTVLSGDESLSKRPMARVSKPLALMGANISTAENGRPPIKVQPEGMLKGAHYDMPIASAQVKSALLLAGLYAEGVTSVSEPAPSRDHTERMLKGFGYSVEVANSVISVRGGGSLKATRIDVPADISSAAFFLVGASISEGSDMLLEHVGVNPTRTGVIEILRRMGADINLSNEREVGGEPVADIRVKSAQLKGIDIPESLVPLAIDEFPAIFIAAACAEGKTVLRGAEELRVKESDRIQAMADGMKILGVDTSPTADGIVIEGCGDQFVFQGGEINSFDDHRIAMAFAMASLRAKEEVRILNCANVATSFPSFVELAAQSGLKISVK